MLFSKPTKAAGIDIGSHSVKVVLASKAGGRLRIENVGYALVDRNQMNVDPISAQAEALRSALRFIPLAQCLCVGALPGQTVVIRYPRLAEMPKDRLAEAIEAEAGQNIPYDLSEVSLDWTPLLTVNEGDKTLTKVLLVAAKHEVIESRVQVSDLAGVQYAILDVDSLALADAAECCGLLGGPDQEETVALVNLGFSGTSIHFTKNGVSNFIRDVNWGGREIIQAVAKAQRCEFAEAERVVLDAALEAPEADAPFEEAPEPEAAPAAAEAPQGPSLLDPLDDELGGLGDLGSPSGEPAAAERPADTGGGGSKPGLASMIGTPLNRLVSEIRRSFDYYEQQLYEQPVSRIVLSGGTAHLPVLRETLMDELGVDEVVVADPTADGIAFADNASLNQLREHPAQFMIALGLAARGVAEL